MRTRSKTKKIRENVRRLPHEVEATLSSWVKCTDPIPREILEEVRSTVLVWMKNVRNYCTKLYEDLGSPQWFQSPDHPILFQAAVPFDDDISATFIHRMILSDVNIYRYTSGVQRDVKSVDIYVGSRHEYEDACHIRDDCSSFDQINVNFHNTLSSEIKDEICSKLASALRALKSRISRICGINELERRTVPSQNKHESTYIHDLRNDQNY